MIETGANVRIYEKGIYTWASIRKYQMDEINDKRPTKFKKILKDLGIGRYGFLVIGDIV